jgi:hypothetical protein
MIKIVLILFILQSAAIITYFSIKPEHATPTTSLAEPKDDNDTTYCRLQAIAAVEQYSESLPGYSLLDSLGVQVMIGDTIYFNTKYSGKKFAINDGILTHGVDLKNTNWETQHAEGWIYDKVGKRKIHYKYWTEKKNKSGHFRFGSFHLDTVSRWLIPTDADTVPFIYKDTIYLMDTIK